MEKTLHIVEKRKLYFAIAIIFILVGFIAMGVNAAMGRGAFSMAVEFSGGTSMDISIGQEFNNDDIAQIVKDATGEEATIQKVGDGTSVSLKTKSLTADQRSDVQNAIAEKYGLEKDNFTIQDVSATISSEMVKTSIFSVVLACLCMLIYVSIRFKDFSMGASAILALCHDALLVVGSYALFRIPLDNSFIAAVLTVLGFSINATIVIFDRVRENRTKLGRNNYAQLADVSVTQTLSRSVFTSLTVFFTIVCLYIFGVQSVREFVLPIGVGVVCGTYSSVFLSANFWYMISMAKQKKKTGNVAVVPAPQPKAPVEKAEAPAAAPTKSAKKKSKKKRKQ